MAKTRESLTETLRQQIHITRPIVLRLFLISFLIVLALGSYVGGEVFLGDSPLTVRSVGMLLIGLSPSLLVAIGIYLSLEQGIRTLSPISEVSRFPDNEYVSAIQNLRSRDEVKILETFTYLINNDGSERFSRAIRRCLDNRTTVQILLMHPASIGAKQRAQQLLGKADVYDELRKNLARFFHLQNAIHGEGQHRIEIKLYTALPSIAVYRYGGLAYCSLFPVGSLGNQGPNLLVPLENPFGAYISDVFQDLWKGSTASPTITLQAHMLLTFEEHDERLCFHYIFEPVESESQLGKCYVIFGNQGFPGSFWNAASLPGPLPFFADGQHFIGTPRFLNNSKDHEEISRAKDLLKRRYEDETLLKGSLTILVLEHIEIKGARLFPDLPVAKLG